jgi:hypothetical protein
MNSYIIVDLRDLMGMESNFEIDASLSSYHNHMTHELLRYVVSTMNIAWIPKPYFVSPDKAGQPRLLSPKDYQANLHLIQNLKVQGSFVSIGINHWDQQVSVSMRMILNNIESRKRSNNDNDVKYLENTMVIIYLSDFMLLSASDDQVWSDFQLLVPLAQLKRSCSKLEIRFVVTIVSQLPGSYNISAFDQKLYRLVDFLRSEKDYDVSYNILHNSQLHLAEEFRIVFSKNIIPIKSKLVLPLIGSSEQLSVMIELMPAHLMSTNIIHPGLLELAVESVVTNESVNICDLEGFPFVVKVAGLSSLVFHGNQHK